jgi:5'-nucleotidase (lipoprotein e(P4) family)
MWAGPMIPSSLQQVFGTLSVGVFAVAVLLVSIWIFIQPTTPFFVWLRSKVLPFEVETPAAVLLALFLYSFGIVTENVTDHLTDSEPRHWFEQPWWPPVAIAGLLGSEQHYRFATLYRECGTKKSCKLGGLGRAVFGDRSYVGSHVLGPDDGELAYDASNYLATAESDDEFDRRKTAAKKLINRLYYTAKNWAYAQETHYDELQAVQRHIEFTRSSLVIACWGVIVTLLAAALGVLCRYAKLSRFFRRRTPKLCTPSRQTSRVGITIATYATIAFFAQQGYGYAEINFNERAFGYFTSELARQRSNTKPFKHPALGANLWVQNSGEYTALCLQAFNQAARSVTEQMRQSPPSDDDRQPAVVLDLDETVINNEKYQGYLLLSGTEYESASWAHWIVEGFDQASLIPGAKAFIEHAQALDVAVVFISNRPDAPKVRRSTVATLKRLGIDVTDFIAEEDRLLLKADDETASKKSRRKAIEKEYRTLVLIGDALGDFSADFDMQVPSGSKELRRRVLQHRDRWGRDWFVLPNPVYGSWRDLIEPADALRNVSSWQRASN